MNHEVSLGLRIIAAMIFICNRGSFSDPQKVPIFFGARSKKLTKLSEKTLTRRYKNTEINRKNKFLAWYVMGCFFYKSYLVYLEDLYQLYRKEMTVRGLLE
ncbi:hypothetical protein [Enterococcus olivae]